MNTPRIPRFDALPTPTQHHAGMLVRIAGDTATTDTLHWCRKLDDETYEWQEIVIGGGGGGGAPTDAKYIVQTSNSGLSAEQSLGALATGILKSTTTTGVLSIATGSDLPAHTHVAADVSDFDTEVGNHTDVAANTAARHTHANSALLATYDQTNANLADAVTKKHAHANSAVLDATTASFTTADETKLDGIAPGAQVNVDPWIFKGVTAGNVATAANTTPVNITGMSFSFDANSKYMIDFCVLQQSGAATTGFGIQIDTSVAVTFVATSFVHQLANVAAGTITGGYSIADDASAGVSSGVPANNATVVVMGNGLLISTSNAGTAQFRLRSETTAVTTMMAGSMFRVMKMA